MTWMLVLGITLLSLCVGMIGFALILADREDAKLQKRWKQ